jgi:hypothetical protein
MLFNQSAWRGAIAVGHRIGAILNGFFSLEQRRLEQGQQELLYATILETTCRQECIERLDALLVEPLGSISSR